jgi:hypothetical protein
LRRLLTQIEPDQGLVDRIAQNLLRLTSEGSRSQIRPVRDLLALGSVAESAIGRSKWPDLPLFPLPASSTPESNRDNVENIRRWNQAPTLGSLLCQDVTVGDFAVLIASLSGADQK